MKKFVVSTALLLCSFSLNGIAHSQLPNDVLKPYKQYTTALNNGDIDAAEASALKAWKKAEKLLKDHKTTGDLALNYALLSPNLVDTKTHKLRDKAFNRAIELSKYHTAEKADVTLDRHLEYLTYLSSTSILKNTKIEKANKYLNFSNMEADLARFNRKDSWHEAVMESLRTSNYRKQKNYDYAIQSGEKARNIFNTLQNEDVSDYKYQLNLDLGRSYADAGKDIEAALGLQDNFQTKDKLGIPKQISRRSETSWVQSWVNIYKSGQLKEAQAKGLCECTNLKKSFDRPRPIMRIPPIMPVKAVNSGEAIILFDVKEDGTTYNIRVAANTEAMFGTVARKAAENFLYTPAFENSNVSKRVDIPVRMLFTLKNGENKIMQAKALETLLPITANQDLLEDDNVIVTTGTRIKVRNTF